MLSMPFRSKAPTRDELIAQNVALQNELADVRRQLAEALAHRPAGVIVERSGCAGLADKLGINERTVRQVLTSHAQFARVREACARRGSVITRDREFLSWLMQNLDRWPS